MAASVEKCIEIGIGLGGLHDCVKRRFCQNGEFARFMRRCNPYNCTKKCNPYNCSRGKVDKCNFFIKAELSVCKSVNNTVSMFSIKGKTPFYTGLKTFPKELMLQRMKIYLNVY